MWTREYEFQDVYAKMYPECAPPPAYYEDGTAKTRLPTRSVTIVVTEQCNLRCSYCYQHNKNNTRMTEARAREIVDLLFEEDAKNNQFINEIDAHALILDFIGGEPLLEIDLIDYFMRYFRQKAVELNHRWAIHYMISISTNGILYNNPKVQQFIRKNQGRLSLTITIDGNKELHDSCRLFPDGSPSYDIVEKSVRDYLQINPYSSTKLTLAPANVKYAFEAIRHLFENIGLPTVFSNCIYEEGWTNEDATIFYYQLKQLADWIVENNRELYNYCSLFDSTLGRPMKPEDNNNWCFTGETLISTPTGFVRIDELKGGDLVCTGHSEVHPVLSCLYHQNKDNIVLKATGIFPISTTIEHPFWVQKKQNTKFLPPQWVAAQDLKKGDRIALPRHVFGSKQVDTNLAYIVGRYIGDGWCSTTGYKLCCGFHETKELEKALEKAHIKYSYDNYRTVRQYNLSKTNNELISIISNCGSRALDKHFPKESYQWNKSSVEALLTGLFDADGYVNKDNQLRFNTISSILANEVLLFLRSLKFLPTCYFNKREGKSSIEGREVNIHNRYEIDCFQDASRCRYCITDEENDCVWTRVSDVSSNNELVEVYNLMVDSNHSFVAGGALVHNCGGNGSMISFTPDGYAQPCLRYTHFNLNDKQPELRIGDVKTGIANLQEYKDTLTELGKITRRSQSTDECFDCQIASGCSWCSGYNYEVTGTPNKRVTFICPMHKARVMANRYFWQKLYKKHSLEQEFPLTIPREWALEIIPVEEYEMLLQL